MASTAALVVAVLFHFARAGVSRKGHFLRRAIAFAKADRFESLRV